MEGLVPHPIKHAIKLWLCWLVNGVGRLRAVQHFCHQLWVGHNDHMAVHNLRPEDAAILLGMRNSQPVGILHCEVLVNIFTEIAQQVFPALTTYEFSCRLTREVKNDRPLLRYSEYLVQLECMYEIRTLSFGGAHGRPWAVRETAILTKSYKNQKTCAHVASYYVPSYQVSILTQKPLALTYATSVKPIKRTFQAATKASVTAAQLATLPRVEPMSDSSPRR